MNAERLITTTDAWSAAFPGAVAGVLAMRGVQSPEQSPGLEARKRELEEELRAQAARLGPEGVGNEPVVRAYADHYRSHGKTYHVRAQWESVAVRGRPVPSRAALVEAMFMAELKNLILTAGHDLAAVEAPVRVELTREGQTYVLMSEREGTVAAGDMMMVDGEGIISSVLLGPDRRTRITPDTRDVLFAAYAPSGIGESAVRRHLEEVRANVLLVAPEAQTELLITLAAG